jgi:hypothetical protein
MSQKAIKRKQPNKKKKGQVNLSGTELGIDVGGFTVIGDANQFRQQTVNK